MSSPDQDAWLLRVFGVAVAAAPTQAVGPRSLAEEVTDRVDQGRDRLAALDPAVAEALADRLAMVAALAADDADGADEQLLEVEDALVGAEAAQRAAALPPGARAPLMLRKLVVEWRAAQDAATAGLDAIGEAFLADKEVQADPRFDAVFAAVKDLPDLLPGFGAGLADKVAAVLADDGRSPALAAAGLQAVKECRSRLDGAAMLQAVEAVAAAQYGDRFRVYRPMADVLDRLAGELAELAA